RCFHPRVRASCKYSNDLRACPREESARDLTSASVIASSPKCERARDLSPSNSLLAEPGPRPAVRRANPISRRALPRTAEGESPPPTLRCERESLEARPKNRRARDVWRKRSLRLRLPSPAASETS